MNPLPTTQARRGRGLFAAAVATFAAIATLATPPAQAQSEYPNKPITLVVGYPPGGSTDLTARTIGADLARRLGQPVVIENIGGAGGRLGAQKVMQAAADGYTLLLGTNNEMAISGLINKTLRYDPQKDFTPLGLIASQPMVLVASPKAGVKTTAEFIELTRKNPGKFSYGSSGVGTALHLAGEMVKEQASLFMVHIAYRGVAPLTTDVIAGQLEYGIFVLSSGLPHIRSGKVIALGTTEAKRSAAAPDIPALAENPALKNVDISSWFALFGPANLPPPVAQRLQRALAESIASADVRKRLEESGATMAVAGIALANYQAAEIRKYQHIVDFAKITE